MTIGERIRHFRKQVLKMTQEDFASKINVSRSNLGNIEISRISATDRVVSDICNAFSISEEWLRTGEGEMQRETESTIFSAFARQYDLSEKEQHAARYLLSLSSEERLQILHHLDGLVRAMQDGDSRQSSISVAHHLNTESPPAEKRVSDAERAELHRLLDEELDAEEKARSASISGNADAKMA